MPLINNNIYQSKEIMKSINYLVCVLFLLILFSFKYLDIWVDYKSSEGHYSISFPGKPVESLDSNKTHEGKPYAIHYASYSPVHDETYIIGWFDMSSFYPEDKTMSKILEHYQDKACELLKTTIKTTLKINLEGDPFIEFSFSNDNWKGKSRIYVINKYVYTILTLFSTKKEIHDFSDRFIQSFKHID